MYMYTGISSTHCTCIYIYIIGTFSVHIIHLPQDWAFVQGSQPNFSGFYMGELSYPVKESCFGLADSSHKTIQNYLAYNHFIFP